MERAILRSRRASELPSSCTAQATNVLRAWRSLYITTLLRILRNDKVLMGGIQGDTSDRSQIESTIGFAARGNDHVPIYIMYFDHAVQDRPTLETTSKVCTAHEPLRTIPYSMGIFVPKSHHNWTIGSSFAPHRLHLDKHVKGNPRSSPSRSGQKAPSSNLFRPLPPGRTYQSPLHMKNSSRDATKTTPPPNTKPQTKQGQPNVPLHPPPM